MEDLNKILKLTETFPEQLEEMTEDFMLKLRVILWGQAAIIANKEKMKDLPTASPQQTKKRVKRLSSLNEVNESEDKAISSGNKNFENSPQQNKRSNAELLAVAESMNNDNIEIDVCAPIATPITQNEVIATGIMEIVENTVNESVRKSEATNLMPPPPAPLNAAVEETLNKRPQRAAKLKSEKNLKEPSLNSKLRRPTNEVKIKLEHEQRSSQMHEDTVKTNSSKEALVVKSNDAISAKSSISSQKSNDSVFVVPEKQPSIISINSETEEIPPPRVSSDIQRDNGKKDSVDSIDSGMRELRIKIKREKISLDNQEKLPESLPDEAVFKAPVPLPRSEIRRLEETSLTNSILSSTTNTSTTATTKKTRKKKDVLHKPIKVERFSDLDHKPSPISSRTRHGSVSKTDDQGQDIKRPASVYEDAVETPPSRNSNGINNATTAAGGIVNDTVNLGPSADATINLGPASSDATFCTNPAQTTFQVAPGQTTFVVDSNPNATVTVNKHSGSGALADATFDVHQAAKTFKDKEEDGTAQRSFETAKDSSVPNTDSILTEDEQEIPVAKVSTASIKAKGSTNISAAAKGAYKMPTRKNELFNPLAQSPVKLRVEAFENAAAAATEQYKRPLRSKKENVTPATVTTPVICKLSGPALGRFLTPTQSSNVTPINSAIAKKGTTSASKALPIPKSSSASSLQRSNSTKTLQRENSTDDFRKGLHNLAEERKKQREQKHLLAAQQREAKERERAERMAKLAREREEKRLLKKQQEQEQKKRELEEIHRKLRQQQEEEANKLKAAKEREMLLQMKQQQQQLTKHKMLPPPPKITSKYTFEMLHEDDSTDDEDKVSYKRPPPPSWSRSHVRGPAMLKQEYTPSAYIDSFFSVQPMTPDLKVIFPNIDARHLKRNSSALWSTPPRYSELPKY